MYQSKLLFPKIIVLYANHIPIPFKISRHFLLMTFPSFKTIAEPGGPDATVEVVRKLVGTAGGGGEAAPADKHDGEDKKDGEEKKADKSEGNGEEVKADGDAK